MVIRPWEIERQRGTSAAPTPAFAQTLERGIGRGAATGLAALTSNRDSEGPQVTDDGDGGDTSTRQVRPYPTVLPPLSPQMLAAIEARRAASLRQLQEAEARAESMRAQAELENVGRLLDIGEETGRERREGMTALASRGVARSPLFANPFRRELARQQQRQIAESQRTLAGTLDQLNVALNAARQRRESELAQIAFDVAQGRSNVGRLMGLE